jgi:hypothetical protein
VRSAPSRAGEQSGRSDDGLSSDRAPLAKLDRRHAEDLSCSSLLVGPLSRPGTADLALLCWLSGAAFVLLGDRDHLTIRGFRAAPRSPPPADAGRSTGSMAPAPGRQRRERFDACGDDLVGGSAGETGLTSRREPIIRGLRRGLSCLGRCTLTTEE